MTNALQMGVSQLSKNIRKLCYFDTKLIETKFGQEFI